MKIVALFAALLGGSLLIRAMPPDGERPVFPHDVHMENEMECIDCHEGAGKQARAQLPPSETCLDCHEDPDPAWDTPELIAFFKERTIDEGKLDLDDSFDIPDLIFSHRNHAERGVECSDCHGDVVKGTTIRSGNPDFKHTCLDCHGIVKAGLECATCHETQRADKPPASHADPSFLEKHGLGVMLYYRKLPEGECFYCHRVDQCDQCHKENMPTWHRSAFFEQRHGERVRNNHMSLVDSGCAFCHDRSGCRACHLQKQPRSHTITFENRTHGMQSRLDREHCKVCHQQAFCIFCHTTKVPFSHRGQFARGQQMHCYSCHIPLQENSCYTCHKQITGHNTLPMPMDPVHAAATPDTCRLCHVPVPHADNGLDCTLCH